ncbi:MAG: Gfo/Idh/MocA family oxidoreductase [Verrucomicrobia bacterium]|nr:Gfo/Idh/MocA family oxidoreductase [Verrucomicrobiota bacterium]
MNTHLSKLDRRSFLSKTAAGAASVSIVSSSVLGLRGATSPGNKLNIAAIGVGGQGGSDLNNLASENIVALCDVDSQRAAATFKKFPGAKRFQDFRRMFDAMETQIDAVLVATPDHMHSVAAMHAIKRGKHVYCEKPLAHSVYEVREMMRAAREHKVVTQLGNQGHSFDSMRVFREWIEDGAIGDVREVHAMCGSVYSRIDLLEAVKLGQPVPETLNWDLWLGPAGERPYHSAYLPGNWRGWSAFGTGVIGDWTCHLVDPVFWTLDLGAPTSIEAETGDFDPVKHGETFPRASTVRYEFAARGRRPGVKLVWHDGASKPSRPKELESNESLPGIGALVIGDKGKIIYGSHGAGRPRILSESVMDAVSKKPTRLATSPGHYTEWIESCKTGKPAGSHFDYGGPLTEIALLGAIAIRCKGEKLQWNATEMKFTNSERANGFLKPVFREGWAL